MSFKLEDDANGILPDRMIAEMADAGLILPAYPFVESQIQPASLDLRLGDTAYRVRASFLPGPDATVAERIDELKLHEIDLSDGAVLETNCVYIVPLLESLALPPEIVAAANPKSSTGRLDVFTRVVTDGSYRFDEIADGYRGPLYLEVVPLSFAVQVEEGLSLNQLRLIVGRSPLTDAELLAEHRESPLLFRNGQPVPTSDLALADGLFLSLDLRGDKRGHVGFRAKLHTPGLDMSAIGSHRVDDYWERVTSEERARIVLDPERFYLLLSEESVRVPPTLAAEMTAFDPTSGELRTHYAGFFDPGFGYSRDGQLLGSRAALEVRAHDVPFMIEQGQGVCKLTFERMLGEPDELYGDDVGSNYQGQAQTLSKHFRVTRTLATEPPQMELFGGDS